MRSGKPILQLMDEFLRDHDVSEASRKKYRDNLHVFIWWATKNADVKALTRADIIRYKQWLLDSKKKAQTIDNYLAAVRQFFRHLEENGELENIAAGIRSPKMSREFRKNHLKPDQVRALLASISRSTIAGKRDYAMINLMVRTGMRCVEVSRMSVSDVTIDNGTWVIYIQGKGRIEKDRVLGITDRVMDPIRDYLAERQDLEETQPMFMNHAYVSHDTRITTITISKIVKRYLRRIGIDDPKLTAHSLRHTAAVSALNNGAQIYDVQQMLGHQDVKTTSIYLLSIAEQKAREGTAVRLLDNLFGNGAESGQNGKNTPELAPQGKERSSLLVIQSLHNWKVANKRVFKGKN